MLRVSPWTTRSHVGFGPTLVVSCRQNSARGKRSDVGLMLVLLCKLVCSKIVCSVGGQSYFNTDPSGIHCNLRTLNCCMTESVRNQYRPLRRLEIAGSGIRTRARACALMRAELLTNRPTRRRGRVARLEVDVYIPVVQWHIPVHNEL